jgi:hypothetical protein
LSKECEEHFKDHCFRCGMSSHKAVGRDSMISAKTIKKLGKRQ